MAVPLALTAGACGTSASSNDESAGDLSGEQIRIVVPASSGGSMDTMARQLQPYLGEVLDANVVVENMPSGGAVIGTRYALENGDDCLTPLTTNTPHLQLSYLTGDVGFSLDDFAPLAGVTIEPGVIRVQNDAPWQSLEELVTAAREAPGEITVSVSDLTSSNYIGLIQIEEATGAEFNIIGYDGGGPARTALLGGEVDVTHAGVFNTLGIADDTRVLAVHEDENLWEEQTDGAPTVSAALGIDLPPQSSRPSMLVSAACAENHPDRYEQLVDAFAEVIASEEYLADLAALGEDGRASYLGPEELGDFLSSTEDEIVTLLEADPDVFQR